MSSRAYDRKRALANIPNPGNGQTHYQILGVATNTTPAELRTQYRKLAIKWHPDKDGNSPAANARFAKLQNANQVLSDFNLRQAYDETLRKLGPGLAPSELGQPPPAQPDHIGGPRRGDESPVLKPSSPPQSHSRPQPQQSSDNSFSRPGEQRNWGRRPDRDYGYIAQQRRERLTQVWQLINEWNSIMMQWDDVAMRLFNADKKYFPNEFDTQYFRMLAYTSNLLEDILAGLHVSRRKAMQLHEERGIPFSETLRELIEVEEEIAEILKDKQIVIDALSRVRLATDNIEKGDQVGSMISTDRQSIDYILRILLQDMYGRDWFRTCRERDESKIPNSYQQDDSDSQEEDHSQHSSNDGDDDGSPPPFFQGPSSGSRNTQGKPHPKPSPKQNTRRPGAAGRSSTRRSPSPKAKPSSPGKRQKSPNDADMEEDHDSSDHIG